MPAPSNFSMLGVGNQNGNIATVSEDGVLKSSYEYDALNQLVREDDATFGLTFEYGYDSGGNMATVGFHPYTTGALGQPFFEYTLGYGNADWPDQMTSFVDYEFGYDELGNMLYYDSPYMRVVDFRWEKGRQLAEYTAPDVDRNVKFKYDHNGLRTQKTVVDLKNHI